MVNAVVLWVEIPKRKDERSTDDGMALSASGWSVALLTVKCGCR